MLFLHTLLFFLLGTSALGIPIPIFTRVKAAVNKVLGREPEQPDRANGYWKSVCGFFILSCINLAYFDSFRIHM